MKSTHHILVDCLKTNARTPIKDLAAACGIKESDAKKHLAELEKSGAIVRYTTVINQDKLEGEVKIRALIELSVRPERKNGYDKIAEKISSCPQVTDHFLISGRYDFLVLVEGANFAEISQFVSELASMDQVNSTTTHFVLKKYKEMGSILDHKSTKSRLPISL